MSFNSCFTKTPWSAYLEDVEIHVPFHAFVSEKVIIVETELLPVVSSVAIRYSYSLNGYSEIQISLSAGIWPPHHQTW